MRWELENIGLYFMRLSDHVFLIWASFMTEFGEPSEMALRSQEICILCCPRIGDKPSAIRALCEQ